MIDNFIININTFFQENIMEYIRGLYEYPIRLIPLILDIMIVAYLLYKFLKASKNSRIWQLIKGIILYIAITAISGILKLQILNFILTSFMTYGVIALIVIFQPELRRGLEQLGSNKLTRFIGIEKDLYTKSKEDIYKIIIAVQELAKSKTGALIVIERDIKIRDIIDTGVIINAEVSPQLLVNIFTPNTPLHDGAVIISDNKLVSAACILPLASDNDIAKEVGTRHRAALGISKESDAIAVVVSEETGKVSIAKDGVLIADLREDAVRQILMKNVAGRFNEKKGVEKIKQKLNKNK